MRNFGRSIGSKGWMSEARYYGGDKAVVRCGCDFGCGCGHYGLSNVVAGVLLALRTANLELALRRGIQLFN